MSFVNYNQNMTLQNSLAIFTRFFYTV